MRGAGIRASGFGDGLRGGFRSRRTCRRAVTLHTVTVRPSPLRRWPAARIVSCRHVSEELRRPWRASDIHYNDRRRRPDTRYHGGPRGAPAHVLYNFQAQALVGWTVPLRAYARDAPHPNKARCKTASNGPGRSFPLERPIIALPALPPGTTCPYIWLTTKRKVDKRSTPNRQGAQTSKDTSHGLRAAHWCAECFADGRPGGRRIACRPAARAVVG